MNILFYIFLVLSILLFACTQQEDKSHPTDSQSNTSQDSSESTADVQEGSDEGTHITHQDGVAQDAALPPEQAIYLQNFSEAFCQINARCNLNLLPADPQVCVLAANALSQLPIGEYQLFEDKAASCISELQAMDCGEASVLQYPAVNDTLVICRDALRGFAPQGYVCIFDQECVPDLQCIDNFCGEKTACFPGEECTVLEEGAACDAGNLYSCGPGPLCIEGTCSYGRKVTEPCNEGSAPCLDGLFCEASICQYPVIGLSEGQACNFSTLNCGNGLRCDPSTFTCATAPSLNEPCAADGGCEMGLFCVDGTCNVRPAIF